jgi:hypothetical protein
MGQVLEHPYHYKPLRRDLFGSRQGSCWFLRFYEINESELYILFLKYQHHDDIYQ